jgi:hypothetical protein
MTSLALGSRESGHEISIVSWSMKMMRDLETVKPSKLLQFGLIKMVNNLEKLSLLSDLWMMERLRRKLPKIISIQVVSAKLSKRKILMEKLKERTILWRKESSYQWKLPNDLFGFIIYILVYTSDKIYQLINYLNGKHLL